MRAIILLTLLATSQAAPAAPAKNAVPLAVKTAATVKPPTKSVPLASKNVLGHVQLSAEQKKTMHWGCVNACRPSPVESKCVTACEAASYRCIDETGPGETPKDTKKCQDGVLKLYKETKGLKKKEKKAGKKGGKKDAKKGDKKAKKVEKKKAKSLLQVAEAEGDDDDGAEETAADEEQSQDGVGDGDDTTTGPGSDSEEDQSLVQVTRSGDDDDTAEEADADEEQSQDGSGDGDDNTTPDPAVADGGSEEDQSLVQVTRSADDDDSAEEADADEEQSQDGSGDGDDNTTPDPAVADDDSEEDQSLVQVTRSADDDDSAEEADADEEQSQDGSGDGDDNTTPDPAVADGDSEEDQSLVQVTRSADDDDSAEETDADEEQSQDGSGDGDDNTTPDPAVAEEDGSDEDGEDESLVETESSWKPEPCGELAPGVPCTHLYEHPQGSTVVMPCPVEQQTNPEACGALFGTKADGKQCSQITCPKALGVTMKLICGGGCCPSCWAPDHVINLDRHSSVDDAAVVDPAPQAPSTCGGVKCFKTACAAGFTEGFVNGDCCYSCVPGR